MPGLFDSHGLKRRPGLFDANAFMPGYDPDQIVGAPMPPLPTPSPFGNVPPIDWSGAPNAAAATAPQGLLDEASAPTGQGLLDGVEKPSVDPKHKGLFSGGPDQFLGMDRDTLGQIGISLLANSGEGGDMAKAAAGAAQAIQAGKQRKKVTAYINTLNLSPDEKARALADPAGFLKTRAEAEQAHEKPVDGFVWNDQTRKWEKQLGPVSVAKDAKLYDPVSEKTLLDNTQPDTKAPQTTMDGTMVWDAAQKKYVPIEGAVKLKGEIAAATNQGGALTEYQRQQLELERQRLAATTGANGIKFTNVNTFRGQYNGQVKPFLDVRDAYRRVQDQARIQDESHGNNPAADISMIFNIMKMNDPGSTVREGEFATAQNATGVPGQIVNAWNRLLKGDRLNPEQRRQFLESAKSLYDAQLKGYQQSLNTYRGIARDNGIDANEIPDYSIPEQELSLFNQRSTVPEAPPHPGWTGAGAPGWTGASQPAANRNGPMATAAPAPQAAPTPSPAPVAAPKATGTLPHVQTADEYNRLQPGTTYVTPSGEIKVKQ